jgi:hypothetical protein
VVGLFVFTLIVILLLTSIIAKAKTPWSPRSVISGFGLVLIIGAALTLVAAGFAVEQFSPAMGLLGAIAGYLLGSTEPNEKRASWPSGVDTRAAVQQPANSALPVGKPTSDAT